MEGLPKRIVVGVSAREQQGSSALELGEADVHAAMQALWLARKSDARVRLLHVVDFLDASTVEADDVLGAVVHALDGELSKLGESADGVEVDHRFVRGLPSVELLREAHRWRAQLIVMAPRRELSLGQQLMFGRTTWRVIRNAACPVWVVHPSRGPELRRIVGLVDRSKVSERVVDAVERLAAAASAERHMLHCLDHPEDSVVRRLPQAQQALAKYHRNARAAAKRHLEHLAGDDDSWSLHLRDDWVGRAAPELVDALGIDCAVVAAVSKPRLTGMLLGTTAERLVERLDTSCFIVRPAGWSSPLVYGDGGARRYGPHFIEPLELEDGTAITLRAVAADDKPLLLRGFEQMSDASRLRRFFTHKTRLSAAELRYLTELEDDHHVAIGAVVQNATGGETGVAVGRFIRFQHDPDVAEPAVAVIDAMQRKGLGGRLLRHLVEAAKERGVKRFRCAVLPGNVGARALIEDLAPTVVVEEHDDMVVLEFELADVSGGPGPKAFERMMALAADGAIRIRRAFPWLESL